MSIAPVEVTASTIIENALRRINVLGAGQTVAAHDQAFSLAELNLLIDHWRARRRFVLHFQQITFTFGTSKTYYSIGKSAGADINADRPVKIEKANLIRVEGDEETRFDLGIIELDQFARIPQVIAGPEPLGIFYLPSVPDGTIYPAPYPENTAGALANKLELFCWSHLYNYATAASKAYLAPGYEDALTWSLCERIAPAFGRELTVQQMSMARESRDAIAVHNTRPSRVSSLDTGLPRVGA